MTSLQSLPSTKTAEQAMLQILYGELKQLQAQFSEMCQKSDEKIKNLEADNKKLSGVVDQLQTKVSGLEESQNYMEFDTRDLRERQQLIWDWVLSHADNSESGERKFRAWAVAQDPGYGPIIDFVRSMQAAESSTQGQGSL